LKSSQIGVRVDRCGLLCPAAVGEDIAAARLVMSAVAKPRQKWVGSGLVSFLLLAPSIVLVVAVLGIPIVFIIMTSLQPNVLLDFTGPALDNYRYLVARAYYVDVVLRTFKQAVLTTVFTVPLGYAAAMTLRELSGRLGNLAAMGITFPILTGPLVVALGWMSLLSDGGPIFGPLVRAGLITAPRLLGSERAVLISLVQFTLPFAMITMFTALRQIPHHLYEAASSLGAGPFRSFQRVTLPLSLPGVLTTAIITFSLAASSYISPHYLGGASELTLTTLIAQFVLATYNSPLASSSAAMLLILMLVVIASLTKLFARFIRP
jgi:putative spermidine/putrescine transport system permease protein